MRSINPAPALFRRAAAVTLTLGLLAAAVAQTAERLPSADEIISKSIEAQGGKAAMEKIHSRVGKGTLEIVGQGVKGKVTSYEQAPNKQCSVVEFESMGVMESGTDGTESWEVNAIVGPRLLKGAEKAVNERQTRFNGQLTWKELYSKAECVGVEEVDGRPCYKVVFTPKDGEPETVWYDRKTYLPLQSEFTLDTPMARLAVVVTPSEYRAVDGVLLPHKVRQEVGKGLQTMEITFSEIKQNVDIPAERFAIPKPVQELIDTEKAAAEKK